MASYQQSPPDEGYSEDPLTVGASASVLPNATNIFTLIQSLPVQERTNLLMAILSDLPTSEVVKVVDRVRPRLFIDFFQYLPPEVILKVLAYLDPISLINTAKACREWLQLAVDRTLWEHLYILEGFRVIRSEVQQLEESLNIEQMLSEGQQSNDDPSKRRGMKQRLLPGLGDGDSEMADVGSPIRQDSVFGPLRNLKADLDESMVDVPPLQSPNLPQHSRQPASPLQDSSIRRLSAASVLPRNLHPLSTISSLVVLDRGDNRKKLNWQYLYSQRRRLEANWENEKYTNFQLPDPRHSEEAHRECIYTIQHSGKYLVSGSRDRTLRIWNLDTRRLVRPPLSGHNGSVLCLQFDASPEEDLIVSGSSDATVILWRFSTGQMIQRLSKAHRESVLNVRFDKHVLVTCSKDKTIKIFNRHPLGPGGLGYPGGAKAVNPVPLYLPSYGYSPAPSAGLNPLPVKPAYSIIGILEGHGAAVNAVQILGSEIVSASGDRTVKVWNWPEQSCTRTLVGHTKGIACVQYDGRRIVSGSSDNEVKVFDKESGIEVAGLRAHTNLVRTVQAGFGDLPYSEAADKEDARMTDYEYFKAVDAGIIEEIGPRKQGRPRNVGSRRPEDITAYGATLPPGGGGGKYGRIVSGSYDETIIIWRRDKEGLWKAQHTLRQEEAARVTISAAAAARPDMVTNGTQNPTTQNATTGTTHQNTSAALDAFAPTTPFAPGTPPSYHPAIELSISQGAIALRNALITHPEYLNHHYLRDRIRTLPEPRRTALMAEVTNALESTGSAQYPTDPLDSLMHGQNQVTTQGLPPRRKLTATATVPASQDSQDQQMGESSQDVPSSSNPGLQAPVSVTQQALVESPQQSLQPTQLPTTITETLAQTVTPASSQTAQPVPAPALAPLPQPQPAPSQHTHQNLPNNMARVFKLQFDARRIICCSQTSVIIGWDFANGDEQLIEASRFFAPIE